MANASGAWLLRLVPLDGGPVRQPTCGFVAQLREASMLLKSLIVAAAVTVAGIAAPAFGQSQPYAGVQLHVASQNDQFAGPLVQMAPAFEKATGIKVSVDILSYPELLTKITADF